METLILCIDALTLALILLQMMCKVKVKHSIKFIVHRSCYTGETRTKSEVMDALISNMGCLSDVAAIHALVWQDIQE